MKKIIYKLSLLLVLFATIFLFSFPAYLWAETSTTITTLPTEYSWTFSAPGGGIIYKVTAFNNYGGSSTQVGGFDGYVQFDGVGTNTAVITLEVDDITGPGGVPDGVKDYWLTSITFFYNAPVVSYTIGVNAGPNGSITGPSTAFTSGNSPGIETVAAGSTPLFTILPDPGYHIASVTGDGTPDLGSLPSPYTYLFGAINNNTHTIAATFAVNHVITVTQGANGTIAPGTMSVINGEDQLFMITAASGCHIESITVDGNVLAAAASYTFINVTADHSITASFANNNVEPDINPGLGVYNLWASTEGPGSITNPGLFVISAGQSLNYLINPNGDALIADVLVNGVSVGKASSYTFIGVNSNQTIHAIFSSGGGGVAVAAIIEQGEIQVASIEELPRTGNNMLFYVIGFALMSVGVAFGSFFISQNLKKREN
jgi:hypothetical protein